MMDAADPAFWHGRQVFVTGGTGLIGSWLIKRLLGVNARVAVLVRDTHPLSELLRSGDLARCAVVPGVLEEFGTLDAALAFHQPDTVFHLGAQTQVGVAQLDPLATFETNIRGTYNLLEACRRHSGSVRRVVVASTDKAYGTHAQLPYTEQSALDARHSYDVSKSCGDLLAQAYHHTYGLPIGIARCGNVYGGGDVNLARIVPGTIASLLRGERPVIRSDGRALRDYIHVEDVAASYLRLAERLLRPDINGQAFNFGNQRPVSVLELVDHLQALMGRADLAPVIEDRARGEITAQYLDASKARTLLGWTSSIELDDGLRRTIDWYRAALAP